MELHRAEVAVLCRDFHQAFFAKRLSRPTACFYDAVSKKDQSISRVQLRGALTKRPVGKLCQNRVPAA